jgi:hypothetical protein
MRKVLRFNLFCIYIYIIAGCIMNKKRLLRFCYFPDEVASVYIAQNIYSTLTCIVQKVMD